MDPQRWKRIEDIYHAVLDAAPERREALLAELCGPDASLREEVESLLGAREEAGEFLEPAPAQPEPLAPGGRLGPYEILGDLGAGGMGIVYRARDARLNRDVALKVLPPHQTNDPSRVARFQREARAASTLSHPNIVTIFDIGEANGAWFIAAELIPGETVRRRLESGPIPVAELLRIGVQCAAALDAAHREGIIHRDIKPENIMVRPDGVVKVLDFGLARITEGAAGDLTQTKAILGTPRYMSPEQARGQRLDARSDIFSLAAVLYEMLRGRPATGGNTTAEIFAALLAPATEADREQELSGSGGALDAVLLRALRLDRDARYQTMAELLDALRAIDPREQEAPSFTRRARALLRRPGIRVSAGMILAAALAFGVYRWRGPAAEQEPSLKLVPLTYFAGAKDFAALSPDGARLAFSWTGGKPNPNILERQIFVKPTAAGDPVALSSPGHDDTSPAWSPDGSRIAFLRRVSRFEREIYTVPASGGPERKVAVGGVGVSWSPDGKWLALAEVAHPKAPSGIYLLNPETHDRRDLTGGEGVDFAPTWSPDGKWIAFYRTTRHTEVYVVATAPGPQRPRQLTSDSRPKLPRLTWTPDSREIVYSTQRENGGEGLWRVPVDGGATRRVSSTLQFAGNPSIASVAGRLAYTETWVDMNIYRSSGNFEEQERIVASSREDHSVSFSPDGARIAFVSNRTGYSEIWTALADGTGQTQLTRLEGFAGTPRWSPDGKQIGFDFFATGNAEIYTVDAAGGTPRRLTDDPSPDTKPTWSPDGRWIYFNSDRSGSAQIWRMPAAGGTPTQITHGGGREVLVSPDGRRIYFTRYVGPSPLWTATAEGEDERPVAGMEAFDQIGRTWGMVRDGLYFVSAEKGVARYAIRHYSFATGRVTEIGRVPARAARATGPIVTLSPDGKTLASVQTDQEINDLMLIENFR